MKQFISSIALFFLVHVQTTAQRAVIPGDFPDPSVIKFDNAYYASGTSSNWAPAYPVLKSPDLKNWQQVGYVFPDLTAWADYYYWAPELSYDGGKVYVYYTAHKKGGNLCVGVASADRPEGPYRDHGPLVGQPDGSIDGFPMRDENNNLYLIWKEDGNSAGKPTPIWIQPMNEERTALTGEKKEIFRNDAPWERNLVEGVSMIRNNGYFYAIYAAAGCCGSGCTYATGIARAKKLEGPWEKYPGNPVITSQNNWMCAGHGTAVKYQGKDYFMYHAYDKGSNKFTGRQALVQRFEFTSDNWIRFTGDFISPAAPSAKWSQADDFNGKTLNTQWNWSVFNKPAYELKTGKIYIRPKDQKISYFGQKIYSSDYQVTVQTAGSESSAWTGVTLIGDDKNLVYAAVKKDSILFSSVKDSVESVLKTFSVPVKGPNLTLRLSVSQNQHLVFSYSTDGTKFTSIPGLKVDVSYLPPWDRAVRAGIMAKGSNGEVAVVEKFTLSEQAGGKQ